MPAQKTKGKRALSVEIDESLLETFQQFCDSRGETRQAHVEMALRRHMAYPPPLPEIPPLPPTGPIGPKKRGRPPKNR